jgi:hypothetical protein
MNVEKFKNIYFKNIILGFGFNKRPLNLNNDCIKNSQICILKKQNTLFIKLR